VLLAIPLSRTGPPCYQEVMIEMWLLVHGLEVSLVQETFCRLGGKPWTAPG
jgi:hypothetical protein